MQALLLEDLLLMLKLETRTDTDDTSVEIYSPAFTVCQYNHTLYLNQYVSLGLLFLYCILCLKTFTV